MITNPRPLRPSDPLHVASYRLVGLLGEGGQGAVYLGVAPDGGQVAVKVLHARLVQDAESRRRFVREVNTARRVGPFGTARVVDVDIEGDQPYIVSEYISGESLQQLISREGPRDAGGMRRLMLATAAALQAIHESGIVHRDFKPSNVLLALDGPRVIDFGIARALEGTTMLSSAIVGTPPYMSPEQLAGKDVEPSSDVFSWAVTMVFAATGRPAFGQDSIPAVFNRILNRQPDLDGVPDELKGLLSACLAKDPQQRPSAGQLLQRILGHHEPTLALPAPPSADRPFGLAFVAQLVVMLATPVIGFAVHYGYGADPDGGLSPIPFPWVDDGIPFWPGMIAWIVIGSLITLALRFAAKRS